jgi:hypothetical protein
MADGPTELLAPASAGGSFGTEVCESLLLMTSAARYEGATRPGRSGGSTTTTNELTAGDVVVELVLVDLTGRMQIFDLVPSAPEASSRS